MCGIVNYIVQSSTLLVFKFPLMYVQHGSTQTSQDTFSLQDEMIHNIGQYFNTIFNTSLMIKYDRNYLAERDRTIHNQCQRFYHILE